VLLVKTGGAAEPDVAKLAQIFGLGLALRLF
jgi:hypothetical protein